jgi:hypothetical protein
VDSRKPLGVRARSALRNAGSVARVQRAESTRSTSAMRMSSCRPTRNRDAQRKTPGKQRRFGDIDNFQGGADAPAGSLESN